MSHLYVTSAGTVWSPHSCESDDFVGQPAGADEGRMVRFNGAQSRTRCPLSTRDAATVLDGVKGLFASLTGFAALDPVFTRCRTG